MQLVSPNGDMFEGWSWVDIVLGRSSGGSMSVLSDGRVEALESLVVASSAVEVISKSPVLISRLGFCRS